MLKEVNGANLGDSALGIDSKPDAVHACKILIIDDEMPNVSLLERVLDRAGFGNFISTTDSREVTALFADFEPDLVLTDWLMPEVDGYAVIRQLRAVTASDDYLPIVVLTADVTPQTKQRALLAGATDFLTKPFDQVEVLLRIQNLLTSRVAHLTIQRQNAMLEESVRQRTIALEEALTALKHSQQQVIQQERLAALGTMAGGIAHDFNNSLSIIMGFGELLLRDAARGLTKEQAEPPLATIVTAAQDAAEIVRRLREFYRPEQSKDQRVPVDLNALVEQAILLTKPRWHTAATANGCTIRVRAELGDIPKVNGDPPELREALTNLIFNAVDALPQGGTITLGTRHDGAAVSLSIGDTGTGMSEETRERCLEPFFSTKGKSGTGLGLSMVFGIVQRHGGTIHLETELGHGTTFTLRLPAVIAESAADTELPPGASGPFRILVVDDQPIFCELVSEYLREDFHTVEMALNGTEALEKFRSASFDLVITDHVMAGMTGEQLAISLKQLAPTVRVILLTGYANLSEEEAECPAAVDCVLGKPLSRIALRRALARVMKDDRLALSE